ncbi:MAG: hypothetical protein K2X38_16520 [Gemmataceae bacterium]|nr:hypothetical protein [Gemmataceae bacterium]
MVVIVVGAITAAEGGVVLVAKGIVEAGKCGIAIEKLVSAGNDRPSWFGSGFGKAIAYSIDGSDIVLSGLTTWKALLNPLTRTSGLLLQFPGVILRSANLVKNIGEWLTADELRKKLHDSSKCPKRIQPLVFDPFAGFNSERDERVPYDPFRGF